MNPYFEAGMRFRIALSNAVRSNRVTIRRMILVIAAVLAVPPIERYWLPRLPSIPAVPISVLVFIAFASIFMLAATAMFYVFGLLLLQIGRNERIIPGAPAFVPSLSTPLSSKPAQATGGTFIAAEDETLWLREQFEILKKQGVLTETDGMDIETMAKELGLKMILQTKGRTE